MVIELPPSEHDLLCLVDGANQQADPDRQELDFRERHLDVAGDDQAFIEDAIENVDQAGRSSMRLRQMRRHKSAILRNFLMRSLGRRAGARDGPISAMAVPDS